MYWPVASSMFVMQSHRILPFCEQSRKARCPIATCGCATMLITPSDIRPDGKYLCTVWTAASRGGLSSFCCASCLLGQDISSGPRLAIHLLTGTYWQGSSQTLHDLIDRVSYWTPHMPHIIRPMTPESNLMRRKSLLAISTPHSGT